MAALNYMKIFFQITTVCTCARVEGGEIFFSVKTLSRSKLNTFKGHYYLIYAKALGQNYFLLKFRSKVVLTKILS